MRRAGRRRGFGLDGMLRHAGRSRPVPVGGMTNGPVAAGTSPRTPMTDGTALPALQPCAGAAHLFHVAPPPREATP
jgi:hypothetical protein